MSSRLEEIKDLEVIIDLDNLPVVLSMKDDASVSSESSGSFTRKRIPSRSPSSQSTTSEGRGSMKRSHSLQDPVKLSGKSGSTSSTGTPTSHGKGSSQQPPLIRGISKQTLVRINSMSSMSPKYRPNQATDNSSFSGHTARSSFSSTSSLDVDLHPTHPNHKILMALEAANRAVGEKGYSPRMMATTPTSSASSTTSSHHRRSSSEVSADFFMTTREHTEDSSIPPLSPDNSRNKMRSTSGHHTGAEFLFPTKELSSDSLPSRENSNDSNIGVMVGPGLLPPSEFSFRTTREFSNDSGLNGDDEEEEESDCMSDKSSLADGIAAMSSSPYRGEKAAIPLTITIPVGSSGVSSSASTPSHANNSTPTNAIKAIAASSSSSIGSHLGSSPSLNLYKKLSSQALDLLACESRDSEEELRLLSDKKKSTSFHLSEHFDFNGNHNSSGGMSSTNGHHTACIPDQPLLKIVLIGDECSGKTSLLRRHFDDQFTESVESTSGVDFRGKTVMMEKEYECKVQLWDTAGASKLQTLTKMYYKGAHVFGIVFDITRLDSIERIPQWITSIRHASSKLSSEDIPIILIGNKIDEESERKIASVDVEEYAKVHGLQGYVETSAKTGEQVNKLLDILTTLAFQKLKSHPDFHVLYEPVSDPWSKEANASGQLPGMAFEKSSLVPDANNNSYHSLDSFLGEPIASAPTSGKSSPMRPSSKASSRHHSKRSVYQNSSDEEDELFIHAKFDSLWTRPMEEDEEEELDASRSFRDVDVDDKKVQEVLSPVIPSSHHKQSKQCQCIIS